MRQSKFTVQRFADQTAHGVLAFVFFNTWCAFMLWIGIILSPLPDYLRFSWVECLGMVTIARAIIWVLFINLAHAIVENYKYEIKEAKNEKETTNP